ncbi:MAG: phosphate ABC transporter substrate-binding protein [Candidatus Omnitrophica bacterium]|nr:phosphate ABC transporter substrate-binding protein [Candidatus Omnitrophota bacterium]
MVNLGQAWAEAFNKNNPEVNVAVTGGGSGTGISALIAGTADIAECSRTMKEKEIEKAKQNGITPVEFTVALDGLAVVVHPDNPVTKMTINELADIFTGKITNWKELGGKNLAIVILSREVNSGTHVYFKEHVLRKGNEKGPEEFSPTALLMPSSQAIADEVSQNPNAIGYYGMGYVSPAQKAIAVAKDKNSPYIEPKIENVKNGKYPISRPLLMYTKGEPQGNVKEFIGFALSFEGQEIVVKTDFVPVK